MASDGASSKKVVCGYSDDDRESFNDEQQKQLEGRQDFTMTITTTENENQEAVMMRQLADSLVEKIFNEAIEAYQKREEEGEEEEEQQLLMSTTTTGNSVAGEL